VKVFCVAKKMTRLRVVVLLASLPAWAQPKGGPGEAPLNGNGGDDVLQKARAIVQEYTPARHVWVRSFAGGLHVIGASVESKTEADATVKAKPYSEVVLPSWCDRKALLGEVNQGVPFKIRLLWRVDPRSEPHAVKQSFTAEIVHHQGYGQQLQVGERTVLDLSDSPYGTVLWSEHGFAPLQSQAPGLYDVAVRAAAPPFEVIPLGQILVNTWLVQRDGVLDKMRQVLPQGAHVFAGEAVLTRFFRLHIPVDELGFKPRAIAVVSSADWLEQMPNGTRVATIRVNGASHPPIDCPIELGRDTASAWYRFHARGNIQHDMAPIAWSSRARAGTEEFDAHTYIAKLDLGVPRPSPVGIDVIYEVEEGVFRLQGIAFLP